MYDGYQVLRFENNYKSKDLYLIGNEMKNRIGTGNYDSERTKFNITFKDLEKENLYQDVKYKLESRNIEYLHKSKTNILNGVTISSGPEFFMTLGLPFKETDRKYKSGKKEGKNILVPDIKSENDIPAEVCSFFVESYEFLKNMVGEENIVMAQIHFDEDTPHLQAYFLPVVNEVKRKCYQRDKDGNLIKEIRKDKNGNDKEVPILLRDENGEMVYETIKGNFLNNDQFWKDLGGRNSFSNMQDKFNEYMKEKGFNLNRGEIGVNKKHQTKLEYHISELKAEEKELSKNLKDYKCKIKEAKNVLEKSLKDTNSDLKKNIIGYSKKEVEKLMDDFNKLDRLNNINEYQSKDKDRKITSLSIENSFYKNNKRLNELERERHEHYNEMSQKDEEIKYYKDAFRKVTRALDIIAKRRPMPYVHNYVSFAESVMAGVRLRQMDEEAQREFDEANNKGGDLWL